MDAGLSEEEVLLELQKFREQDLLYDRFFSTMCTRPHRIAVQAHNLFLETNLGDPGLFPGASELERRAVAMIGEMLGCPDAVGYISTGGTESNIQAIRAARNACAVKNPNIVVPQSAHFSFDKIGDLLSLEVRKAPLDSQMKVDMGQVRRLVDDHTVAIVGIAGTTEFGQVDPIEELAQLARQKGIFLHVDAAFGGFVLPFLSGFQWDFRVDGVSSITVDPHKMGLSVIPAGGLLFRSADAMRGLETETHYLTVSKQVSLTGTRAGAAAAATYAVMRHMGRDGYTRSVQYCLDLTRHLLERTAQLGLRPVVQPVINVVALAVKDAPAVRYALMDNGWQVSMTREPRALRIILMPHMTKQNIDLFVSDLDQVLRTLGR